MSFMKKIIDKQHLEHLKTVSERNYYHSLLETSYSFNGEKETKDYLKKECGVLTSLGLFMTKKRTAKAILSLKDFVFLNSRSKKMRFKL